MKAVFADSNYWIAIVAPHDQWAAAARQARESLGDVVLLTTDEVLSEFLTALSSYGEKLRQQPARMVRAILDNPNVKVLPQTRDSFLRAVQLYEERADKTYSLTDCVSMNAMRAESVSEILTHDHHFVQEGFEALMTKS